MTQRHLDDLTGLPVTSGGHYDPEPSGAVSGCAPGAEQARAANDGAVSGDVVERVRVGPYTADIQLERRQGGLWIACAMVSTETGVLSWCGAATEQEVAQHLANRRRAAGAAAGFDFGSFLNNLGSEISRGAQQLARNRTLRRVVRDVNQTLNRPELAPVMAVAQQIPYLGQALGAVRAAATMADQVLQGSPRARGRLQGIRRAAQQGNPIARQALEVLGDVLRAQQSSAQQRAGASRPRGRSRQGRHHARRGPSRHGRARPRGPGRRGARRSRGPHSGARSSGLSESAEQAWAEAESRWAELVAERAPIVPPPPAS